MDQTTFRIYDSKADKLLDVLLEVNPDGSVSLPSAPTSVTTMPVVHTISDPGENHIGSIGGRGNYVSDEFSRPADVVPYSIGDAVSQTIDNTLVTPLRLIPVSRVVGGSGYITSVRLVTDQKTCTAIFRIHLYRVMGPTSPVRGDNLPMAYFYANNGHKAGTIDLPGLSTSTVSTDSTCAETQDLNLRIPFKCYEDNAGLFYRLETLSAFTPVSGQKFYLELGVDQD